MKVNRDILYRAEACSRNKIDTRIDANDITYVRGITFERIIVLEEILLLYVSSSRFTKRRLWNGILFSFAYHANLGA